MPKNSGEVDEAAERVELDGTGNKDGAQKRRFVQRKRSSRNKRVKVIGIAVAVLIVIVIIVGAWFIYTSLHDGRPEWLQTIPGLHYRPENLAKESLITYNGIDVTSYSPWIDVIDNFLKDYDKPKNGVNYVNCDYTYLPSEDKICYAGGLKKFGPCIKEDLYGYRKQSPCIFLKIHKFPNWVPEYYNDTSELPETMPDYLKARVSEVYLRDPNQLQKVWVSCDGVAPADKENVGPVIYMPDSGFPGYFFPASDKDGYLSPLVAMKLERPRTGVLISIECKLWAKNIAHDKEKGVGVIEFEILID